MAKIRLRKFSKRIEPLPWQTTREAETDRLAAKIKQIAKEGKGKIERRGNWEPRRGEPSTTAPRRKGQLRKPQVLEAQFDVGSGPRSSKWWDLFKDGINNSGIGLWLGCKHQFWLRYVCGYEVPVYNDSLEFGNIFHWIIERWLKGRLDKSKDGPLSDLRKKYHPEWMGKFDGTLSAKNRTTQEVFYSLAASMWPVYVEHYKRQKLWKGREVVSVEKEFTVKHKLRDKTSIKLYGTIDLITRADGGEHLEDHKTASFINQWEIEQSLGLNFQLMFYAFCYWLETGRVVKSVSHDVIRRTASKPHKGESLKDYGKRIGRDVAKSPEYYFERFTVPVNAAKLRGYQKWIIEPMLEDLAAWARGTAPHYPNPNALLTKYGPCKLFGPITTGNFSGIPRKRPTTRGVQR